MSEMKAAAGSLMRVRAFWRGENAVSTTFSRGPRTPALDRASKRTARAITARVQTPVRELKIGASCHRGQVRARGMPDSDRQILPWGLAGCQTGLDLGEERRFLQHLA